MTVEVMGPVNRLERGKVLRNGLTLYYFSKCSYTRGLLKPAILPDGKKKKKRRDGAWIGNEFIIMVLKVKVCYLRFR